MNDSRVILPGEFALPPRIHIPGPIHFDTEEFVSEQDLGHAEASAFVDGIIIEDYWAPFHDLRRWIVRCVIREINRRILSWMETADYGAQIDRDPDILALSKSLAH